MHRSTGSSSGRDNVAMARRGVLRCLAAAVLFGASAPAASQLAGDMPTLVLGPAFLVAGLVRVPAAEASLLLNFELVATTIIAAIVFHEHLGGRLVASVLLVLGAGVLLVWQPGSGIELGGLFVVAACVCWGIDNSATARIDQLSPEQITFAKGAVAGTANLVLGLAVAGTAGVSIAHVLGALVIGAFGYGLSITLWVKGARDLGAARGQVVFAAAPSVGAVIAWTVLAEPVTGLQLLALMVAAAGVALSLDTAHTHVHVHEVLEHEHEHSHDDQHLAHGHTEAVAGRHTHRHRHERMVHEHPHLPDLHHRHPHR